MSAKKSTARRPLPGFGTKGYMGKRGAMVRGIVEKGLARILWTEGGKRRMESWPDTADGRSEAKVYGEGVADRLRALSTGAAAVPTFAPVTVRAVWDAYKLAEWDQLRRATKANYTHHWRLFEAFYGAGNLAGNVTREHLDAFRKELRSAGVEVNQIGHAVAMVKRVIAWAVDRDILPPSKVPSYRFKIGKDEKRRETDEYTREEAERILAQFDPRAANDWRQYVAITVFAFAGPRANATLWLEWRDVDLAARTVHWRPELDKTAKDRVQPLPDAVVDAFWIAYGWRTALGYAGPYVFFRPSLALMERARRTGRLYRSARRARAAAKAADKPWAYSSFHGRLLRAEIAAGVRHREGRAAHGFRRLVVGDVLDMTGNLVMAGQYVGDVDLKVLRRSYVKDRPEQLRGVADQIGRPAGGDRNRNRTATEPENASAPREGGAPQDLETEALT